MTITIPLTDPQLFLKRLGDFIPAAYGSIAVPEDKMAIYEKACSDALLMQTDAMADHEKVTFPEAKDMIDSGEGTPDHVIGFATRLKQFLSADFFEGGPDFIQEALLLQTYGRIVFMMNNQLHPSQIIPCKEDGDDMPAVKMAQDALTEAQVRRLSGTRPTPADHATIQMAASGIDEMVSTYTQKGYKTFTHSLQRLYNVALTVSRNNTPTPRRPLRPGVYGPA